MVHYYKEQLKYEPIVKHSEVEFEDISGVAFLKRKRFLYNELLG